MSIVELAAQSGKWSKPAMTHTVEFFHSRIRELVAQKMAESGKSWEEVVDDPDFELSREDFEQLDAELLGTGYRYEMSAQISLTEAPDKYRAAAQLADTGADSRDEAGRLVIGTGANVFRAPEDLVGTARLVSTVETVMEMLVNGVPENTIAVIDDSGGTLTAPILEHFAGVLCMGGTVRSHLGILTREYQIPCLMNATVAGISEGDEVQVEYSRPAKSPYEEDGAPQARIWKLS